MTHRWYLPEKRPDIEAAVTPTPTDPNVSFSHYAQRWPCMTRYEKALFYWLEVHRVGFEEEEATPPDRFARFRFEET